MSRYAIVGGPKGKQRLDLLARVLAPTTARLLEAAGVAAGMSCLDVGCGGGHVTRLLAAAVGPTGVAVGLDADAEILELARADASHVANATFVRGQASGPLGDRERDVVYARFLLSHLDDPAACVRAMAAACRPGGHVVVEDIDFAGSFSYPPSGAYERYVALYEAVVRRRGGDPHVGPRLPGLLGAAGLGAPEIAIVQPVHTEGEGKWMAAVTMARIADAVLAERLATAPEIDEIVAGLEAAAADPTRIIALPRVFQVWARKPLNPPPV